MNTFKLLNGFKIIVYNRSLLKSIYCGTQYSNKSISFINPNVFVNSRNMSQKITSFFKITPKKSVNAEDKQDASSSPIKNERTETSECNGNVKRSKRLRSTSKENSSPNSDHEKESSPVTSAKKKKAKRQRIVSSESEGESPDNSTTDEAEIKLEKSAISKTYDSSKIKKSIKCNGKIEEKKIKVEKKSPKTPKSQKKETKKSPSFSKSKATVKTEKEDDEIKRKDEKNIMETDENMKGDTKSVKVEDKMKEDVKKIKQGDKNKKEDEKNPKEEKEKNVAETDYNPAKVKYHPINDACWSKGQPVPYLALARTLEIIEATSARLKMVEILSNYFRSVITLTPEDLLSSIYLCLNQLGPAYASSELGIAETYLMKAVGQCTGRSLAQMRAAAHKQGDLGAVAEQARATQRTMFTMPPLQVRKVFTALKEVAAMTGQASVNKKIAKIQSLYVACRHSEARYLIRSLEGKLRIGLAEQSLLQALALACAATPPAGQDAGELSVASNMNAEKFKARVDEYALIIKTTYCECPNYDLIVPVLLQHGVAALPTHCKLTPGIPLKPMLAHPTKGVHEIFNRFENEEFTCEWKYDGERAQIHVPGDDAPRIKEATIFSRNQENNTSKYPDILKRLPSLLKETVKSCVLDCEAVAYDTTTKQILPFQILSTRKRKDASEDEIKVQVCVFMFDLLYYNGRALVKEPLEERRRLLRENFNVVEGEWQMAVGRDCRDEDEIQQFLQEAVKASCEGLMVKMLKGENSRYDIARRSHNWLKLKKDYLDGVGDTIDTVVIGGYRGKGKRAGAFGGFLLACYDAATEQYQSLCKIGTGFSDEDLKTLSDTLNQCVIDGPRNYYMYDNSHAPDAWFSATCVWEVRCADLSLSPAHRAAIGLVDPDKGISLRFPRFIRVREDKSPEQATSAQQIAQLYLSQDQVKNSNTKQLAHDDFY